MMHDGGLSNLLQLTGKMTLLIEALPWGSGREKQDLRDKSIEELREDHRHITGGSLQDLFVDTLAPFCTRNERSRLTIVWWQNVIEPYRPGLDIQSQTSYWSRWGCLYHDPNSRSACGNECSCR